jgi:hypothetical protein
MGEGKENNLGKLEAARQWLQLRKKTVITHWLFGGLCAAFSAVFFPAGFLLMGVFAGWERWNDKCDDSNEGAQDWWDAFLIFCIGLAVILILHFCDIMAVKWY